MADPFAAMLGIGIDDEQKMQALADRLRGRQGAAEMFTLSTVPQISAGAVNEQNQVGKSLEQVGGLRKALAARRATAEENRLGRDATMERDRLDRDFRSGESALDRQSELDIAKAELEAEAGQGQKLYNMTDYYELGGEGRPVKIGQDQFGTPRLYGTNAPVDLEDYELSLSPSGLASARTDLLNEQEELDRVGGRFERIDRILEPYTTGGDTPEAWGEIPGTGRLTGKSGNIGHVARLAESEYGGDASGEQVFAAVRGLFNDILREGAGKSQTITELRNMMKEYGDELFTDPSVAREALREARRLYNKGLNRAGRRSPQVLSDYRSGLEEGQQPFWEQTLEELQFPDSEYKSMQNYGSSVSPQPFSSFRRDEPLEDGWDEELSTEQLRVMAGESGNE